MSSYPDKTISYSEPSTPGYALKISFRAGIAGGILLILYFLIIKITDFHMNTNLRYINFVLIIPGAIYSLNKYISTARSKTYLKALVVSSASCVSAYFILAVFMFIYLLFDHSFMNFLHQQALPSLQLTPLSIFVMLMFEGLVGGIIISFVIMQYFKDKIRDVA